MEGIFVKRCDAQISPSRDFASTMSWKKVEFKGSDSVDRLQRIQALCPSSDTKLDGILIIGGVDSFHSQASQAAIKYLSSAVRARSCWVSR